MSLFSIELRKLIEEHKVVIKHLAYISKIDRTTLQHILSGKRIPNKEQLACLLQALPISPNEKNHLLQTYEKNKIGENLFHQRQKIKEIIESIAVVSFMKSDSHISSKQSVTSISLNNLANEECLKGTLAINNALLRIIQQEDDTVTFFMPPKFSFFYDTLLTRYIESPTLSTTGILSLSNIKNKTIVNLEYLKAFIPFFSSEKTSFQAYYIYSNYLPHDISVMPFPYFILTSRYLLALSSNLDCAFLTKSEPIMEAYQKICQDFLDVAHPLYATLSLQELLEVYTACWGKNKLPLSFIEGQPCFSCYLTKEMAAKYTDPSATEEVMLIENAIEYFYSLRETSEISGIFTKEGLQYFVDTGVIVICPPQIMKPLDIADRIKFLKLMLQDIKEDTFKHRLANTAKFSIPHYSVSIGIRDETLFVSCFHYATPNVKTICLTEKFIIDAFTDFFEYLPGTNFIYSKEETMDFIEMTLRKIENEGSGL